MSDVFSLLKLIAERQSEFILSASSILKDDFTDCLNFFKSQVGKILNVLAQKP